MHRPPLPPALRVPAFLACAALIFSACGADPKPLSRAEADDIRQRARQATDGDREMGGERLAPARAAREAPEPAQAEPEAELTSLPPVPPGHLSGDGFGPGQREAVLDARKAVSEQIVASMKAMTDTQASEDNGRGDQSTSVRVQTQTAFDHVELIKTLGVVRRGPNDFIARAVLDRDAAIAVYVAEVEQGRRDLEALAPLIKRAVAEHDTSVLLRSDRSPSFLAAEQRRRARIIEALGGRAPDLLPEDVERQRQLAMAARSRSVIRLRVEGGSESLQRSVLGQISRLLEKRGCTVVEQGPKTPEGGVPTADAVLKVASKSHQERELQWVYVGFELDIKDSRSGRAVFRHAALPSVAHGGGVNASAAESAALRAMAKKLPVSVGPAFEALTCR